MEINELHKLKPLFTTKGTKIHEVETEPAERKNRNLRRFHLPADKVSTFSLLPSISLPLQNVKEQAHQRRAHCTLPQLQGNASIII